MHRANFLSSVSLPGGGMYIHIYIYIYIKQKNNMVFRRSVSVYFFFLLVWGGGGNVFWLSGYGMCYKLMFRVSL